MNRPSTSSCTRSGSASARSILLIATIGRSPRASAFRVTNRVCGIGPSAASTRISTPSTMRRIRSTSPPKSAWPGRIHDVDLDALPADGRVLGQDRDPPLPLERVGVHDPLLHLLVGAERAGLPEHLIHQGGLAVVDVGDDGQITDQAALRFPPGSLTDEARTPGPPRRIYRQRRPGPQELRKTGPGPRFSAGGRSARDRGASVPARAWAAERRSGRRRTPRTRPDHLELNRDVTDAQARHFGPDALQHARVGARGSGTTAWPLIATMPLVTVQTWRSCTAATPGTASIRACTSARETWRGTASSRMSVLSRISRQAPARMRSERSDRRRAGRPRSSR